jgi:Holliday junction DNA helicase RuvB
MFEEIVGQSHVKNRLEVLIKYSLKTNTRLSDLFFAGPGGTGKSTLSRMVYKNLGKDYYYAELNSTSIKNMAELLGYLYQNCKIPLDKHKNDSKVIIVPKMVIFIDEAHEIREPLVTQLLNATDERRSTTFYTKNKEVYTVDFSQVTFIMATTNKNDLASAFLSRFQIFELNSYTPEEIAESIQIRTGWTLESCLEVGKRAKSVMRIGVNDIPNIKAFLAVVEDKELEPTADNIIRYYKELKNVDDTGLDSVDYGILSALYGTDIPLGLKDISNRLGRPENEIELAVGFMTNIGLIDKVSRGRSITLQGQALLRRKPLVNVG